MIDESLRLKLLPAELIISGFIEKEELCNCEKYLLEFVNKSSHFLSKSNGQLYHAPPSEANGECDCNSDIYKFDFKLIASQSLLRAKSDLSRHKILLCPGVTADRGPKKRNNSQEATNIYVDLRELNYEQLCQLRQKSNIVPTDIAEKDVFQFLETLETKKHLLLFFPYYFSFDVQQEFSVGIEKIQNALNNDFQNAMKYRKQSAKGFDTYMAYLYDKRIIFMEEQDHLFHYVDDVKLCKSPIFVELSGYIDNFRY